MYEKEASAKGTERLWNAIVAAPGYSVIGGGDSVASAKYFGVAARMGYVCTAGGGMVRFMSGKVLPVVDALQQRGQAANKWRNAMKTTFDLAYGHSQLTATVPSANVLGVFDVVDVTDENVPDEGRILRDALENPIASARLRELAEPGQKVVIVTSDMTRPCPSDKLLPPVLAELNAAGVPDADITVVIALGLHRRMTEVRDEQMVGAERLVE